MAKRTHPRNQWGVLEYEAKAHGLTRPKRHTYLAGWREIGRAGGAANGYRVIDDLVAYKLISLTPLRDSQGKKFDDGTTRWNAESCVACHAAAKEIAKKMIGRRNLKRGTVRPAKQHEKRNEPLWVTEYRRLDALYQGQEIEQWRALLKAEVQRRLKR